MEEFRGENDYSTEEPGEDELERQQEAPTEVSENVEENPQRTESVNSNSVGSSQSETWGEFSTGAPEGQYWMVCQQICTGEGEQEEEQTSKTCVSETEETKSSETKEKSSDESVPSEALSNVYSKLSPFRILWAFGINKNNKIVNLTKVNAFEVLFVTTHFAVIYNYRSNTMTFLPGHNFPLTSIDADPTGRWLVTADSGDDSVIIIWDWEKKLPVWSIYNAFPEGVDCAKISQDSRFLAAINCDFTYSLKFWLWTYGKDEADGEVFIDPIHGRAKHIDFNHLKTEQFAITTEHIVIFCEWDPKAKRLDSYTPRTAPGKKHGILRQSIFLEDTHTALTSTSNGYVVLWSDLKYTEPSNPQVPGTIAKNFLKAIKFHETGITSLCLYDKIIATCSEGGVIFFHDQYCRLMYSVPKLKKEPLVSMSFNLEHLHYTSDPFAVGLDNEESSNEEIQQIHFYDYTDIMGSKLTMTSMTEGGDKNLDEKDETYFLQEPVDCTLDRRPFFIPDFMILTANGKLGYVSHRRKKVKFYLYESEEAVLSLDCHPNKPHLILGNAQGQVVLYDFQKKKRLLQTAFSNPVTTLKYSPLGHKLLVGFQNGDVLDLDPLLLKVNVKVEALKRPISKICFSHRDDLLAFYDDAIVQVLRKNTKTNKWDSVGKYKSHYKSIVDIMFVVDENDYKHSRLFTLGKDRMLVEYDMKHIEEKKLKILSTVRIEQSAVPCCFMSLQKLYRTPHFLISNDQYKLKVINGKSYECVKTTLGPTADTPIKFMQMLDYPSEQSDPADDPETAKMVYLTNKHIGLRLLPPTGNPFDGIGMVAHPEELLGFAVSHDHNYVFTVGVNDATPLMWEVNASSVDVASQLGGKGIEPFISLMEGGSNSFLFKEMEDFFYYSQIIHQGEDPNMDRSVTKYLALCEIPDMFRALGYFPTNYEVDNLIRELRHLDFEKTGELREEVSFEECVKAFLNHRPVSGTSITDINNALLTIADVSDPSDIIIERTDLYNALEEKAEGMDHAEAVGYLCILLLPQDENNPVPHALRLCDFAEQVLGIDLTITEENVTRITHAFEYN